jgi:hypothetical protein
LGPSAALVLFPRHAKQLTANRHESSPMNRNDTDGVGYETPNPCDLRGNPR